MDKTKILALKGEKAFLLIQFIALVGIATVAPLLNQQAITGPIVNATLFISVILLGVQNAILVSLIPSLIALSVGLLPSFLAPMIPFIMVGNIVLIMVFDYLKNKSFWLRMILASVSKFIFLLSTSSLVISLISKEEIISKVSIMMGWSQLLTALAGGFIAYIFLNSLKAFSKN